MTVLFVRIFAHKRTNIEKQYLYYKNTLPLRGLPCSIVPACGEKITNLILFTISKIDQPIFWSFIYCAKDRYPDIKFSLITNYVLVVLYYY